MASLSLTDFVAGNEITAAGHNSNNSTLETWSTSISDDNFSASAGMYTAYRRVGRVGARFSADAAAGTYLLGNGELVSPGSMDDDQAAHLIYLDDADWAISGMSTRLRVRGTVLTNGTVPAITFTFGLYPVTFSGAADTLTVTAGTVVASSTAAIASPAANSAVTGVSSDFAVPSDGPYMLAVVTSAQLTNNAATAVTADLEVHWT